MLTFFQQMILGIIQGIFEWVPLSSKGMLFLVQSHFAEVDVDLFIKQALLLHLGTFFAALIYFRKDVYELLHGLFHYRTTDAVTKKTLNFLIITTLITGVLGMALLNLFGFVSGMIISNSSKIITFLVGVFLLITGVIQLKVTSAGNRAFYHLKTSDGIILGVLQGIAVLPGISRSGMTTSGLLFRNFDDKTALKLSFLMSLPVILFANIILNFGDFNLISGLLWGVLIAFLVGLVTIHLFMKLAEKVNFGIFAIIFAIIIIISSLIDVSIAGKLPLI